MKEPLSPAWQHVTPRVRDEERGALDQADGAARAHPDPRDVGPRVDAQVLRHPILSRSLTRPGSPQADLPTSTASTMSG